MPASNERLKERLARNSEITLTVKGRKTGRTISLPVWFVVEGDMLYLLPAMGSDTQWYKNVLHDPMIRVAAGGAEAECKVVPVTDSTQVSAVVDKFRKKHGAGDVRTYYSKFDVAATVQL